MFVCDNCGSDQWRYAYLNEDGKLVQVCRKCACGTLQTENQNNKVGTDVPLRTERKS